MTELKADVLVLGAGMVGVSAALHLQKRGRDVILVDRHARAGEETSFGNAGLIECASVFPYMFPRDFGQLLQYAINRAPQARYHFSDLPTILPWLVRYFIASSPERALHSAMAELPLIRRSLIEHEALIAEAQVPELLRRTGWLKLFRFEASLANAMGELERAKQYGVSGEVLDAKAIALARQFFGLPDLQPMQTAVMDTLQQQMMANIEKVSPETLMQNWFTFDPKIAERFSDMFVTMAGLGGARGNNDKK
jgi:D-amino-acid dehydrogenase